MTNASRVFKVFERQVRLPVFKDDLIQETGLTHQQVASAINTLRRRVNIVNLTSESYMYDPNATKATVKPSLDGKLFELLGKSRQGKLVIQDENGNLYVAEEL